MKTGKSFVSPVCEPIWLNGEDILTTSPGIELPPIPLSDDEE